MASKRPDDSVRLYSILDRDRPEGPKWVMGDISVIKKFGRGGDWSSAYNGWKSLHAGKSISDFDKLLRAELMEKAKKKAKELDANAIVDWSIDEGHYAWKCSGTAVLFLMLVKEESRSEEGNNNVKKEKDDDTPPAKKRKPVAAKPKK